MENNTKKKPTLITPYNAQNIGNREEQQDYFAYSNMFDKEERLRSGVVAVLADGMGGMKNGRQASHTATDIFLQTYLSSGGQYMYERLYNAAMRSNTAVKMLRGAGTTIVAAIVKAWRLYWLSIGDSRLYVYRNRQLIQVNETHNYAADLDEMVDRGEISLEEAASDSRRAALTSYLGIDELTKIDINDEGFRLKSGDSIMLCTDGLFNALSDREMSYIISRADDDVCDVMIAAALAKGVPNQDNITVMLMDID